MMQMLGQWPDGRPLVAMAVGHCAQGEGVRGDYFRVLMAFLRVDSYGGCLHNSDIDDTQKAAAAATPSLSCFGCNWPYRKEKLELFKGYPFALSFENSNCYDYVTEKLYDVLLSGAVPIYLGAPNIEEWAPAGSYMYGRRPARTATVKSGRGDEGTPRENGRRGASTPAPPGITNGPTPAAADLPTDSLPRCSDGRRNPHNGDGPSQAGILPSTSHDTPHQPLRTLWPTAK